jgi:DNA-binding transcriptional ArsR family regulator
MSCTVNLLPAADDIYVYQTSILKTLASPKRLEIVHILADSGPMEVRTLVEHLGLTQPAVSQHLAALRAAGLVEPVRSGREVRYRLVDPEIVAACTLMRQVLLRRMTRLGDMAATFADRPPITPQAAGTGR